ncbi:hypothetical protein GUY44_07080 [Pimelobacter simplex]|uniref:hypothetical protein n=1 Tax=Nocardioides simplex TaxID=2045 RepID=UPI0005361549|nr:hypothetical protein [Pimelobacter simplex]MCG8150235.1 hypothetical protein [Pimelobacter simplex]GEB13555.1 hypothetical protein NSI01_18700 [Pimelobacter simplex]SFM71769.1 hypothetical protein SAMN05421671_3116 [Pimelobacter simplex]
MSEENNNMPEPSDDYLAERAAAQPDPVLGLLADSIMAGDSSLQVTLTVGGSLVTGVLVSRTKWINDLMDHYGEAVAYMDGFARAWSKMDAEAEQNPAEPAYAGFLHLVEARVVSPAGFLPNGDPGAFWRGRLSEVQGWSLGVLQAT